MLSTPIEKKKNQGPNRTALPFPGSTTPDLCFFFVVFFLINYYFLWFFLYIFLNLYLN